MKVLLIIAVIAVAFTLGEALKCYAHYPTADSFDKDKASSVNCSYSCEKDVGELSNGTMYARGCGQNPNIQSISFTRASGITIKAVHSYFCTEDLCNGANSLVSVSLGTIFLTVAAVFYGINH